MTEYRVPKCTIRPDICYRMHYLVDGKEVTKEEWDKARKLEEKEVKRLHKPQRGRRGRCAALFGDRHDFGRETDPYTGLNGRYFPQLARFQNDPKAVIRHVNQAVELGKHRGYTAERWA